MENRSPVKYLYHLAHLIRQEHEIDIANIWKAQGLELTSDRSEFVEEPIFQRACDLAFDHVDDPALGIKFGLSITITHFGPLGAAMMSCATFADAVQLLLEYSDVFVPFEINATEEAEGIRVEVSIPAVNESYTEFHALAFATGSIQFFNELLRFIPKQITIELPLPAKTAELLDELTQNRHVGFSYNQKCTVLNIPYSALSIPLPRHDEVSKAQFIEICQNIQKSLTRSEALSEQIAKLLDTYENYPSIEQLSQTLNISDRTLRYRLKKEATNYREIISQHRLKRAKDLLKYSTLSIDQITEETGYKDTPSFYRAFKKEIGCTPAAYRKQHNG